MFLKSPTLPKATYTIFIVGWYGTETVGDKAILGGIVEHYKKVHGDKLNVVIGSLYPFISDQTVKELGVKATVVSTSNFEFLRYSKVCDEVVMGGGPLMDLNELYVPLLSFTVAKKYRKKRTVYGCGLGPIYKEKYKNAIKKILTLATDVKLRDYNSMNYALNEFGIRDVEMIGDPAKDYLKAISNTLVVEKENTLSLYLRDWEYMYGKGKMTLSEFENVKLKFEKALSVLIKKKATELNVSKISFNHMHNFVIGEDDRDFSRRFIKTYFKNDSRVEYSPKLSTVDTISKQMIKSKFNICMRFHSVLFAETLQTDYLAIDYTMGGKIEAFLKHTDKEECLISIDELIEENEQ